MIEQLIAHLFEQAHGGRVVVLDLGDYLVPPILDFREGLHQEQSLARIAFPSLVSARNHDVDFSLVGLDPLGEEEVDVAHHALLGLRLVEDQEGVLEWVCQPGLVVFVFFLQSQRLRARQVQQLLVLNEPSVVLFHESPRIGTQQQPLSLDLEVTLGVLLGKLAGG